MANEIAEWAHHYTECWGYVPLPKSKMVRPTKILKQLNDTDFQCVVLSRTLEPRTTTYSQKYLNAYGDFPSPRDKLVNYLDYACFCSTPPARQYKKGIYYRGISRHILSTNLGAHYPTDINEEHQIAWGWNKAYPLYKQVYDEISDAGAVSRAFDYNWALACYTGIAVPILMYKNMAVGRAINDKELAIISGYKAFFEHLEKLTGSNISTLE